jgi:hypothetical protein
MCSAEALENMVKAVNGGTSIKEPVIGTVFQAAH